MTQHGALFESHVEKMQIHRHASVLFKVTASNAGGQVMAKYEHDLSNH
jgi:hypothetical protein